MTSLYFVPPPDHRDALLAEGAFVNMHHGADVYENGIVTRVHESARDPWPYTVAIDRGADCELLSASADQLRLALLSSGRPCPGAINRLREAVARALGATEEEIAEGVRFSASSAYHGRYYLITGRTVMCFDGEVVPRTGATLWVAVPALASLPSEHRTLHALAHVAVAVLGGGEVVGA